MPTQVRCRCQGNAECKLCLGKTFYAYQPGPRGWMPFTCPTCEGGGVLPSGGAPVRTCFTCAGAGTVDPASPPYAPGLRGALRIGWKIFFGGG
ncbi:unnamed protein product [Gemmata massiliana]|uniref:Uncharacterized protein n=1 Tax=Gemmata massiliana TaxID=1210884 RepID=A0A6P2CWV3_9BACT|nr:hypothetical protein [Gemmata massiliana]VTR91582.1 unnamed protein product [Gemmata massiliana]